MPAISTGSRPEAGLASFDKERAKTALSPMILNTEAVGSSEEHDESSSRTVIRGGTKCSSTIKGVRREGIETSGFAEDKLCFEAS